MAKCYVIKNKDGKYWNEDATKYENNINDATLFPKKGIKNLIYTKDEHIVECTICEGNIEEELKLYKKALAKASQSVQYAEWCIVDDNYVEFENIFLDLAREEIARENSLK